MNTLAMRAVIGIDPKSGKTVCRLRDHEAAVNVVRFWGEHRIVTGAVYNNDVMH